ncbi:response regulator transcription factor [Amphibacillus sp. Q70]|uniref:response regulator transcription factor n=1 Tax=Amphibacillus sp. Q70 TaxID=3453416 RepID=UPI003F82FA82
MTFIFVYNALYVILCTVTLTFSLIYYLKENSKLYLAFVAFIGLAVFDNLLISMTEFIFNFAEVYNKAFMTTPILKTSILILNCLLLSYIAAHLIKEKVTFQHYAILIGITIWWISVPLLPDSALQVWFYFLPYQLYFIYIGFYLMYNLKKKEGLSHVVKKYSQAFAKVIIIFGVLITLEDRFVIFTIDKYDIFQINNRSFTENFFYILTCLLILNYFLCDKDLLSVTSSTDDYSQQYQYKFQSFCQVYQLTKREQEIFQLLLEKEKNQVIADTLHLSLGTVKTHIHNIFIKLNINKRTEIIPRYQLFVDEQQVHSMKNNKMN